MSEKFWILKIETERLILRLQQPDDYQAWYAGFANRQPQQSKYDEGAIQLDSFDREWFADSCKFHQEQALSDYAYIFGIFSKQTNQHLGYVDLSTIQFYLDLLRSLQTFLALSFLQIHLNSIV
jgi:[ribosomal protein S5]-alanine N-acetyltransferase